VGKEQKRNFIFFHQKECIFSMCCTHVLNGEGNGFSLSWKKIDENFNVFTKERIFFTLWRKSVERMNVYNPVLKIFTGNFFSLSSFSQVSCMKFTTTRKFFSLEDRCSFFAQDYNCFSILYKSAGKENPGARAQINTALNKNRGNFVVLIKTRGRNVFAIFCKCLLN
jgi:hypothetical protein